MVSIELHFLPFVDFAVFLTVYSYCYCLMLLYSGGESTVKHVGNLSISA